MNFTKKIKWQLILAAVGVSLFVVSAARAQEITNNDFDTPAASVGANFNSPAAAAANTAVNNPKTKKAAVSEASILPANQQEEASVGGFPRTLGSLIALGVLLIACGMLWKTAGQRQNHILKTHNSLSMRKHSLPNRRAQALHS
ncbi:MAG TPA: hypothetical protein VFI38_17155 [Candidatus Acidoferrum sp.]|nr:hypothetical protein [Candidatus Acidoferrum sp.]